jgi:hypothetical protein
LSASLIEEPILKDDPLILLSGEDYNRKISDGDDFARLVTETLEEATRKPKY